MYSINEITLKTIQKHARSLNFRQNLQREFHTSGRIFDIKFNTTKVASAENSKEEQSDQKSTESTKVDKTAVDVTKYNVKKKHNMKATMRILKSMMKYIWPKGDLATKSRVVISVVLMLMGKGLNVYVPVIFKNIIDDLGIDVATLGSVLSTTSVAMLIGYGAARLGATALQELRTAIFSKVQQDAIRRLAKDVYKHLLNMDMKFHLSRETGGLTRAVDRGTKGISFILSSIVVHLTPTLLEIGIVCGVLGTQFGSQYVYTTLLTMIAYISFTLAVTRWRTKFRVQMNKADNQSASIAMDSLLNVEAVKYFNAENYQIEKYDKALMSYHKAGLKTSYSLAFLNAGQNMIFSVSLAAMMYMAAKGVIQGNMSIGDVVMVNGLVFQLSLPLNFLGTVYREMNQAIIDMDTLFNLESIKPLVADNESSKNVSIAGGPIVFKNVSFSYTENRPILRDVSFEIPIGKKVAFVGPSGCGKSTILRLLYRFYNVDEGQIYIENNKIEDIKLESLRKSIAIVPQDTVLFNATIFENIAFGNTNLPREDVIEAAKRANIHSLIMSLPQGYETPVGERGLMISGGERQRIALARALLKNSPIILFDEATSALDAHTEQSIMSNIKAIISRGHNTAVFIAHRLRTIKDVDLIYVLDKGKLVEVGTHSELLQNNGTYSELWKIQEHESVEPKI
ncbi:hypothetical protein BB559_001844 [Furculomyces boomerangus]|uniref:Iron-sulfur clusters transporter ATM1, mitochondrial n=2 Tax=Harpellales TaxID=61421 RepID=A0A2T9Z071_9FUNG|nr:hypothetical protein BB559_001844 [Furculomyces boomerangus]PWA03775.1 hypothetical protein BB558_000047 [Smittium angustum]